MIKQGISSLLMWLFPVQCTKIYQYDIVFVFAISYLL